MGEETINLSMADASIDDVGTKIAALERAVGDTDEALANWQKQVAKLKVKALEPVATGSAAP